VKGEVDDRLLYRREFFIAVNGSYPPFPLVPFGGFKESGLGRELGPEGLVNFLEPRSIGVPPGTITE
jgi:acyl-CoA reductase-like NAD-dependent aldehyde dehydrogenase